MMTLDFKAEIDEQSNNACKSVLLINSIDEQQNIYLVKVIGFRMFFYAHVPSAIKEEDLTKEYPISLTNYLNKLMGYSNLIDRMEPVWKECFLNYKGSSNSKQLFFKIFLNDHYQASKVTNQFKAGFSFNNVVFQSETYESNVNYAERLMIEKDISGMGWIQLPADRYTISKRQDSDRVINLVVHQDDLISLHNQGFEALAPLRVLSFDIECHSFGKFPDPAKHEIITIGMTCKIHGEDRNQHRVIL